jgi:hypothetical protein
VTLRREPCAVFIQIAVIAKENGCCVFTLDRHFKDLGPHLGIELLNPVNEQSAQRKPLNSR